MQMGRDTKKAIISNYLTVLATMSFLNLCRDAVGFRLLTKTDMLPVRQHCGKTMRKLAPAFINNTIIHCVQPNSWQLGLFTDEPRFSV